MDILSLIGLVLAACAILIGAVLKGAGIQSLLSGAAFMIVIVGTIAAICLQTPLHVMKRALSTADRAAGRHGHQDGGVEQHGPQARLAGPRIVDRARSG
jgi:flagellar motor component MotA